jgi:hypothetical protein
MGGLRRLRPIAAAGCVFAACAVLNAPREATAGSPTSSVQDTGTVTTLVDTSGGGTLTRVDIAIDTSPGTAAHSVTSLPATGGSPGGVVGAAVVSLLIGIGALIVGMRGRSQSR